MVTLIQNPSEQAHWPQHSENQVIQVPVPVLSDDAGDVQMDAQR